MTVAEARAWLAGRLTADEAGDAEPTEESESAGESEPHGLRQVFSERSISLGTMERNLRVAVVGALLVLVAAAVFVGLRDVVFHESGDVGASFGVSMPEVVFWLTIAFLTLAWTYVLWGLLHAHRLVRIGGLALFSWAMFELWHDALPLWIWRMAPSYALLAGIWVVGLATMRIRAKERWQEELQVLFFPILLVLVGGMYAVYWWRLRPLDDPNVYTLLVYHQLVQLSYGLIPLLYVAGVDFAEWGDAAATRIGETLGAIRAPYVIAVATSGLAAWAIAYRAHQLGGHTLWTQIAFGGLLLGLVGVPAAVATRSRAAERVPYAAVFAAGIILLVLIVGGAKAIPESVSGTPPKGKLFLRHPAAPSFQIAYPELWSERTVPAQGGLTAYLLGPVSSPERFYAVHVTKALAAGVDPLKALFAPQVHSRGKDGPWSLTRFTGNHLPGEAWQRRDATGVWLLVGLAAPARTATDDATFESIVQSWTRTVVPALTAERIEAAEDLHDERVLELAALAWLGLALIAAFVVLARRTRNPAWLSSTALFLVATGVLYFLVELPNVAHRLGFAHEAAHLRFPGLQLAVAVATLVAVALLVVRRRPSAPTTELIALLLVLNGGLLAIQWLDRAIVSGENVAGRFSVVQAVLIIGAFGWDILMSGEAITNRHTTHVPRQTRVLVYLGYVMLVTSAVLFFSSLRFLSNGTASEPGFESESYPDSGLLIFGSALLVTLFVLRLGRLRKADGPAEVTSPSADSP